MNPVKIATFTLLLVLIWPTTAWAYFNPLYVFPFCVGFFALVAAACALVVWLTVWVWARIKGLQIEKPLAWLRPLFLSGYVASFPAYGVALGIYNRVEHDVYFPIWVGLILIAQTLYVVVFRKDLLRRPTGEYPPEYPHQR